MRTMTIASQRNYERRRAKTKSSGLAASIGLVALFVILTGITTVFSGLMGESYKERARWETIRAVEGAREARRDTAVLRRQVDRLLTMESVDRWATSQGFVRTTGLEGLVARSVVEPEPR